MIKLKDISKIYTIDQEKIIALKRINLEVEHGDFIALIGPSGSGKSTLLNLIGGLDRPTEGDVVVKDYLLTALSDKELALFRNKEVGFVFQMFNLEPRLTALENVALPLLFAKVNRDESLKKAEMALDIVDLSDRLKHKPYQLSGGQRQRVAIARALVNEPEILLADEPTGNLDRKTSEEILNLLKILNQDLETTIILVTHDERAAGIAKRKMEIEDGEII